MDSILQSIKKLLGITEEYEHFDMDITMHINSVFPVLAQLGLEEVENYVITDGDNVWSEIISDSNMIELIRMYVFLKVRLLFDPPQSSNVMQSIERIISEYEWRIHIAVDRSK